jgi:tryptophan synthase beta chain
MADTKKPHCQSYPDAEGYYGQFGGNHYPPEVEPALRELAETYEQLRTSPDFQVSLDKVRTSLQGRPTPIHHLENISKDIGGAQIYVKREDLNHTGAHKINHCVGFALLAKEMGKTKLIAETGAGQHGVALATAAAYFGLDCEIHMGDVDVKKQSSNVGRMRLLGARVVPATAGQSALKEASDSAFNAYVEQRTHALYAIGSAIGPHPFPLLVRDFQAVVGREARSQFLSITDGVLPDHVVACVAGGSNAMGLYSGFLDDESLVLHAVEPQGSSEQLGQHAATLSYGRAGTLHGARSIVLQQDDGSTASVSSVASGLVYPGIGPEIAMLHRHGRIAVSVIPDEEVIGAFFRMAKREGIIPALESAHALAFAFRLAARCPPPNGFWSTCPVAVTKMLILCLSTMAMTLISSWSSSDGDGRRP